MATLFFRCTRLAASQKVPSNMAAAAAVSASSSSSRRWLQNGVARLTATCHNEKTRLTQVSHQAPLRLVPIPSSSIQHAGAALCALSSYGGGMLPGDSHECACKCTDRMLLLVSLHRVLLEYTNDPTERVNCRADPPSL